MLPYALLRPLLFSMPPERAHRWAIHALRWGLVKKTAPSSASLRTRIAGLYLPNPVGLAAGFDKNAEAYAGALGAGFGFVEIGTVTPRAQSGNAQPRLFRLKRHEAVINRLGFNNEGAAAAAKRLSARESQGVIGGNIGKNKETVDAIADYLIAMRTIYVHVDYITVNISSPNTPGLRALQAGDELRALARALQNERSAMILAGDVKKPIFVKIAPDNDDESLRDIAKVAMEENIDGLIVSNTTLARDDVLGHRHANEQGGLSGKPLFAPSTHVLEKMYRYTRGQVPLIGVGGIRSAHDAYEKILAGASAVQLYTGLIYQGIGLLEKINRGLAQLLARDGFATVGEAVGKQIRA